jgi:hypothetical protein
MSISVQGERVEEEQDATLALIEARSREELAKALIERKWRSPVSGNRHRRYRKEVRREIVCRNSGGAFERFAPGGFGRACRLDRARRESTSERADNQRGGLPLLAVKMSNGDIRGGRSR